MGKLMGNSNLLIFGERELDGKYGGNYELKLRDYKLRVIGSSD
jgi:hypothetical protein